MSRAGICGARGAMRVGYKQCRSMHKWWKTRLRRATRNRMRVPPIQVTRIQRVGVVEGRQLSRRETLEGWSKDRLSRRGRRSRRQQSNRQQNLEGWSGAEVHQGRPLTHGCRIANARVQSGTTWCFKNVEISQGDGSRVGVITAASRRHGWASSQVPELRSSKERQKAELRRSEGMFGTPLMPR